MIAIEFTKRNEYIWSLPSISLPRFFFYFVLVSSIHWFTIFIPSNFIRRLFIKCCELPKVLKAIVELWREYEIKLVGDANCKGRRVLTTINGYKSHLKKYLEFIWFVFTMKKSIFVHDQRNSNYDHDDDPFLFRTFCLISQGSCKVQWYYRALTGTKFHEFHWGLTPIKFTDR